MPVAATQVGSAAAGTAAGLHSITPDPLLEDARTLVHQLMHASAHGTSRGAVMLDWCVGVFHTPHGTDTVVVSNEGGGYIPAGVHFPRSARMLFADSALPEDFRRVWFARANPAATMLAYGRLLEAADPNISFHAAAVSIDNGGSAVELRNAGVPHYCDVTLFDSPIPPGDPVMPLDSAHLHRLQVIDAGQYSQLMDSSLPPAQLEDIVWSAAKEAVDAALAQASTLAGMLVAPILSEVLEVLGRGGTPSEAQWEQLDAAGAMASMDAGVQRATSGDERQFAGDWARGYHNVARAAALLGWWRGSPQFAEIAYEAAQIMAPAALWSANDTEGWL